LRNQRIEQLKDDVASATLLADRALAVTEDTFRRLGEVEHESTIDRLTGLYNQNAYQKSLEFDSRKSGQRRLIIEMDIDNFKLANELHPKKRQFGDQVLHELGRIILTAALNHGLPHRSCLRSGGDEFTIYIYWPKRTRGGQEDAEAIAQGIIGEVKAKVADFARRRCPDIPLGVSAGFGLTKLKADKAKEHDRVVSGISLTVAGVRAHERVEE
jgi:diguanylate cyclase (GGDEF)-like protein